MKIRLISILLFTVLFFICLLNGCSNENGREPGADEGQQPGTVHIPQKYDSLKNISAFPGDESPPFDISFSKVATFGESEDTLLQYVGKFVIDKKGQVFIENRSRFEVFDSTGNHIKTLGRRGRGPSEFMNMASLNPKIKSQKLYAYDDVLRRVNVFNTSTFELSETITIDGRLWSHIPELQLSGLQNFFAQEDSLLLFEFMDLPPEKHREVYFNRYYVLNHKQNSVSDGIFKYKLHPDNNPILFRANGKTEWPFPNASGRYTRIYFDDDNNIYTTDTDDFFIKVYSPSGEYERAIFYPYQNRPLDTGEIINSYDFNEMMLERAENYDYPDTWPAIDYFFVDDEGRIWVATITEDENNFEWWVLESNGELLARFKWPGNRLERADRTRLHPQVKNGFWYIRETDSDTGIRQVVKYKIEFTKR